MKSKIILLAILLCTITSSFSQTVFRGKVVDAQTKEPIKNSKIGITNQGVGVITDNNGNYIYKKYEETLSDVDKLRVSAAGYESIELEAKEIRSLFNRNSTIQLEKNSAISLIPSINEVKIYWDISEGMQERDLKEELAILGNYLNSLGEVAVTLEVFNNRIVERDYWPRWDGDLERFRESVTKTTYNAPSNYSILLFDEADAVILVSNGEPNYGKLEVRQEQPVYVVSSNTAKEGLDYFKNLTEYTSGKILINTSRTGFQNRDNLKAAQASNEEMSSQAFLRGKVTSLDKPLQGATITVKGDLAEYTTKADGTFKVPASEGDVLLVRALGMFPKGVAVQSNTELTIDMIPSSDQLDEVVVVGKEKIFTGTKIVEGTNEPNMPGGVTSLGDFYITNKDITPDGKSVAEVLREKFKGIWISYTEKGEVLTVFGETPLWYVNGFRVAPGEPIPLYIPDNEILSIIIKEPSPARNIAYGGDGEPGLQILITTKNFREDFKEPSLLVTNNDYSEELPSLDTKRNTISGTVTGPQGPIQGAEVLRKGSFEVVQTKVNGSFEIVAEKGDVLLISSLGMYPQQITIIDNQKIQSTLKPISDVLDKVVITGEGSSKEKIINGRANIETGMYNAPGVGSFDVITLTNEDINFEAATSIATVLNGRFANVKVHFPETYERGPREIINVELIFIDGIPVTSEQLFVLPPQVIKSISFSRLPRMLFVETNLYGATNGQINSALIENNNYEEDLPTRYRQISGTVTGPQGPIQGADVLKKGSFDVVQTKADGSFEMVASQRDVFIVSALGMFSKEVLISEEQTYYIQLLPDGDLLNEVKITGEGAEDQTIDTFYGKKNPDAVGYDVKTLTSEDIKDSHYNLVDVLRGRFSNITIVPSKTELIVYNGRSGSLNPTPMLVDIDGQIFSPVDGSNVQGPPLIDPSRIESISIIKGLSGVARYGRGAEGGVVIIKTKGMSGNTETLLKTPSPLVSGNDYTEEPNDVSKTTQKTTQKITGKITSLKGALTDASITKKGTFNEVNTDNDGRFTIDAALGEVLVISASGMFTKEILIESPDLGTIQLTPKTNDLDAIVLEGEERVDNTVETAEGKINAEKLGYTAETLDENNFSSGYTNLRQLITGKVAGVDVAGGLYSGSQIVYKIRGGSQSIENEKPPIWIVNGTPYQDVPNFLDVQQIKSITVLKSTMATSRYGSLAAGGAFLIKTKEADFKNKAAASNTSALVSGNEYTGDVTSGIDTALPSYILRFRESGTPQQQLALYKKLSRTQESPLEYYVDAAQYFQSLDPKLGDEVRSDLAYIARNNTKALRTLAYLYELVDDTENVVLVNERIVKIAPQEAQSYRDLALAYQNNKQFDKALELYINMLGEQILGVNFEGLEKPLQSELSRLVALHKDKIDYSRLPNEWLRTDFKRDMRMVIDWSDRSVPFEFQFVNPDKKFFKWTHTLEETRDRLEAEQRQGFQTEEFIIDDAPAGEWLINIQYLGDEGDYVLPPFLKYTVYRNYGTSKETKEVRVIKLFKQVDKVTLGRVTM